MWYEPFASYDNPSVKRGHIADVQTRGAKNPRCLVARRLNFVWWQSDTLSIITENFHPEHKNAYLSARIEQKATHNFKLMHPVVLEHI